jgi:hypothetical protein
MVNDTKIINRVLKTFFDTKYYLEENYDVAISKIDPLQHWLTYGASEQRSPNALINPYLVKELFGEISPLEYYKYLTSSEYWGHNVSTKVPSSVIKKTLTTEPKINPLLFIFQKNDYSSLNI